MLEQYLEDIFWCFETDYFIYGKVIKIISKKFQVYPKQIAKIFILFSFLLLLNPGTGKYTSDIILLIPIITVTLFSSFNKIKFDNNDIFVYWSIYSIVSILDPLLQTLTPLYYILKVFIFSLIYLSPLKYGIILKDKVMKKINMIGVTVENFFSKKNKSYFENTQNKETLSTKTVNNSMSDSPTFQISEDKASINDSRSKISIYDSTNNSSELLKKNNKNVLSSNEISESILYAHPGDIAFSVDKFLSFPKNFITEVSECVYIKNLNTSNPMVFNIKTNAPNCVNAIPGKAIINNGETLVINILLRPMSEGFKIHKIIIVIEYNIAPIGTKTFSSNLIDGRYKKIFKLCHY